MSPLRTSHLRDPLGPEIHFANESFMDEVAFATGTDPVEFRLRYVSDPRDQELIKAAAEKAGWQKRTAARRQRSGDVATGQGIGYSTRAGTRVAVIAEVDVNLKTGRIRGKRFVVAHDCGIIINPQLLTQTIEGNILQAFSRALYEEVSSTRETSPASTGKATRSLKSATSRPPWKWFFSTGRTSVPPAPARARCAPWSPQSPTRSTTRPALGCVRVPSRPIACVRGLRDLTHEKSAGPQGSALFRCGSRADYSMRTFFEKS